MAESLGRAPSIREISRNNGRRRYRATLAEQAAFVPSAVNWHRTGAWREWWRVLQLEWSPQQIAGWLKHKYPEDENYQVSHETIYRSLYVQARGLRKS